MHEFSIVQALMDRVEAEAAARRAIAVTRISVRLGAQSGVDPGLLRRAYSAYRIGTISAAAALDVTIVPERWLCSRCGRPVPRGARLVCGQCGAPARLDGGDEIVLDRVELEVP
jgi:hydrogenase nickel incorporation protein HypA/HybF